MKLSMQDLHELEKNEAWLARLGTPGRRREAIARTKVAIAAALAERGARASQRRWGPASGFWAAAAMLLLSAGVVWRASLLDSGIHLPGSGVILVTGASSEGDDAMLSSLAG